MRKWGVTGPTCPHSPARDYYVLSSENSSHSPSLSPWGSYPQSSTIIVAPLVAHRCLKLLTSKAQLSVGSERVLGTKGSS